MTANGYKLIYSPRAAEDIAALEPFLQNATLTNLERLAASPVTLSRPSVSPPYPPNYQMYEYSVVIGKASHHFVVLFKYSADEQSLVILGIGHRKLRTEL